MLISFIFRYLGSFSSCFTYLFISFWQQGAARGYSWDLTSTQREHVHGEMIPPKESTCMESWSHPGESTCIASPCRRRDISPPNPLREIYLSTMREGMHGERVSPSLDPREHACTWRKSGESSTNAYP